jgi:hypothetical protein
MQSCFQVCQQKCPTAPPPGPTVNGQLCESYGSLASGTEAQKACDLTMVSKTDQNSPSYNTMAQDTTLLSVLWQLWGKPLTAPLGGLDSLL